MEQFSLQSYEFGTLVIFFNINFCSPLNKTQILEGLHLHSRLHINDIVVSVYNFISPVFLFSPVTQRGDETKCTEASCVEPNVWRKIKEFDLAERRTVTFMQLNPRPLVCEL